MTPIKNGTLINLPAHNCALRSDSYHLKGYGWLFRVNNHRIPMVDNPDFVVKHYDDWYDENAIFGTMIVPDRSALPSVAFAEEFLMGSEADRGG